VHVTGKRRKKTRQVHHQLGNAAHRDWAADKEEMSFQYRIPGPAGHTKTQQLLERFEGEHPGEDGTLFGQRGRNTYPELLRKE